VIGSLLGLAGNIAGPWRLYAELAVVAALSAAVGSQTWRLHTAEAQEATAKAETATVRGQWASQVAEGAKAGLKASEANRQITAELQRTKEEADHARQVERDAAATAAAGFAAERDRLRRNLAAYAAGPAGGSSAALDSVAACHLRAAALGDGLASTLRAEEDVVGELELSRADTRAMLDAWPKVAP
jgi:hypothetical protein